MTARGQEAPRITSTLGLVAVELGVALVPAAVRRVQMNGVAYCDLVPLQRPTVPLHRAVRRGTGSAALRNLVDLVRRAAKEAASDEPRPAASGV